MEVLGKIFSGQVERGNYTPSKGYINYFVSYEGVNTEDLYNLEIFKINEIYKNRKDIVFFKESIPNPNNFDIITYFKSKLKDYIDSVEKLDVELIKYENINMNLKKAIDIFVSENKMEFANDIVKQNFIVKIMSWIKIYLKDIQIDKNEAPIVIFYGPIKKHEIYLLIILHLAGFDVLYLNPRECNVIDNYYINKYHIINKIHQLAKEELSMDKRIELGEIIDKTSIKKAMTVGAMASKRISEELLNDSGFIKPWQLQDRKVKSLLLSSTIDEISIYYSQPSKLRPGFYFDNENVVIPVFFSKINGVFNDTTKYLDLVKSLKKEEDVFFVEFNGDINKFSCEFSKEAFGLSFFIKRDQTLDKNSLINELSYTISTLHLEQKIMLLEKIEEVIANDVFIEKLNKEDIIKGLFTVLNMNKKLVYMINNFDYSMVNPKIVMYIEKGLVFTKDITFLLLVLNKIGFDIILLSPGGESCIENMINNQLVDIHRLDKMAYELKLSSLNEEIPLLKKIFGKRSGLKWQ